MMNRTLLGCALVASLLVLALPVMAEEEAQAGSLAEAINKGTPLLSFLYRYEEVDQANMDKNAHASTLRTTVGYRSLVYKGFNFLIEAQNVTVIGNAEAYNNLGSGALNNGVTDRPVVADPAQTLFNQAYFQWQNSRRTNKAQLGREEIIIGDARFVGNVGWRQNHQSYDAFTFTNSSLNVLEWSYRYLNRQHRINGSTSDMASHLINVDLKLGKIGTLALYGYLLDFTRSENYGLSTSTMGGEFRGKFDMSENLGLLYELEFAQQDDYADNPNKVDAQYYFLMAGLAMKPLTVKVGYEVLGGQADEGQFSTPLATLHKFNGWADKFLKTPTDGLTDLYLQANGKLGLCKWLLAYHSFKADTGGLTHGQEFDALVSCKTSWKQTFGLKAAFYTADDHLIGPGEERSFNIDTNKFWVFTSYSI